MSEHTITLQDKAGPGIELVLTDRPPFIGLLMKTPDGAATPIFMRVHPEDLADAAMELRRVMVGGVEPPTPTPSPTLDENDYGTIAYALGLAAGGEFITTDAAHRIMSKINER